MTKDTCKRAAFLFRVPKGKYQGLLRVIFARNQRQASAYAKAQGIADHTYRVKYVGKAMGGENAIAAVVPCNWRRPR